MEHNFERLKEHILSLSESKDFDSARSEWKLTGFEFSEEFDNCPCGKEIKEHCYIRNLRNHNQTYVGNICIKRFMDIDTGNLFDGLKRITLDKSANPNEDLIKHAYELGYIFEREYDFLMSTRRKRKLSEKQMEWKKKINKRIISKTVVQRRSSR